MLQAGWDAGPLKGIRVLGSLAADNVDVTHVPPIPTDGLLDGPAWAAGMQNLYDHTLQHTIADFRQDVETVVDGDVIRTNNYFRGVLKDGAKLDHCVGGVMHVKDGRIFKTITIYNTERSSWQDLVNAMNA